MEGEWGGCESDEGKKRWTRRYDGEKGFVRVNRRAEIEVGEVWEGVEEDGDWPHAFDEASGGLVDDRREVNDSDDEGRDAASC